jgi:predicted Zn-dependent peptidase
MKITVEDIKRDALSRFGGSSVTPVSNEEIDAVKLANQLRLISSTSSSDDLAMIYLDMIKEAHKKARTRLGLGEHLSLR